MSFIIIECCDNASGKTIEAPLVAGSNVSVSVSTAKASAAQIGSFRSKMLTPLARPEFIKRTWIKTGTPDSQFQTTLAPKNRIVGGSKVKPNSLPWQVAMLDTNNGPEDKIACGGTILCPKFIMTAGHCIMKNKSPKNIKIKAGKHDLSADEEPESVHKVKAMHLHPDFKNLDHYQVNDFAILELMDPIVFRREAKALFVPKVTDTAFQTDTKFVVSGWGAMKAGMENGDTSQILNSVTVPWISEDDCKKAYKDPKEFEKYDPVQFVVSDSNICAGAIGKGEIDACYGDSGGPMAWIDPKTEEVKLIGVVSYGFGCARGDSPGVYAKITFALDWIKKIIGKCNEETCSAGNCMKKDSLDRQAARGFRSITPH